MKAKHKQQQQQQHEEEGHRQRMLLTAPETDRKLRFVEILNEIAEKAIDQIDN